MKETILLLIMHFVSLSFVFGQEKVQNGFMGIAIGMDVKNDSELAYFADNLYGGASFIKKGINPCSTKVSASIVCIT